MTTRPALLRAVTLASLAGVVGVGATGARADELSGADKLRVLYSSQFAWTRDGLPLMTVRLAEGQTEVRLRGALRALPDGEMGAEVQAGGQWTVRLLGPGQPAREQHHVVVARAPAAEAERLRQEVTLWRERGFVPRTFEIGAIFGIRGEVIDARQLLLAVAPHAEVEAARAEARALAERFQVSTSVHPEQLVRPRGVVEARDERGTVLRNDGVLWFAPQHPDDTIYVEPPGRRYFGQIYVTPDRRGTLAVVNAVPEDRLLAGLVPAEMNASAPLESLKAQAVAARNQLLAKVGQRHLGDPYRLCAQTHCQVYAGAGSETARTTQAVSATRGELLVGPKGGTGPGGEAGEDALVDTVYSASCGGHTEDNDKAWGTRPDPLLRGHLDLLPGERAALPRFAGRIGDALVGEFLRKRLSPAPLCARVRAGQASYRWSARVKAETMIAALGPAGAALGPLREVRVLERGASGRVVALLLRGAAGSKEVRPELEVRRVLGGLRSSLFVLSPVKAGEALLALDVIGGGHGHGVGMCQHGAMALGEAGASFREILQHYYPGARLRKLY